VIQNPTVCIGYEIEPHLYDWFIGFETQRREQEELDEENADSEWVAYKETISFGSTDARIRSVRARISC
jgi:hypothetical protein